MWNYIPEPVLNYYLEPPPWLSNIVTPPPSEHGDDIDNPESEHDNNNDPIDQNNDNEGVSTTEEVPQESIRVPGPAAADPLDRRQTKITRYFKRPAPGSLPNIITNDHVVNSVIRSGAKMFFPNVPLVPKRTRSSNLHIIIELA